MAPANDSEKAYDSVFQLAVGTKSNMFLVGVPPRLPLVSDPVCDIQGQDLKAQPGLTRVSRLASSVCDLQRSLGQFAADCRAAGIRISTSRSEAMVLCRKTVDCSLRNEGVAPPSERV